MLRRYAYPRAPSSVTISASYAQQSGSSGRMCGVTICEGAAMNAEDLRDLQAPVKSLYRAEPGAPW